MGGVTLQSSCHQGRTIAKSVSSTVEAGDGLRWAEGASLGSQGHGYPGRKPSFQAQGVQPGVDQGGEYLAQPRTAQRVDVLIPTAVLHVMQAVLNAPVVAEQPEQFLWSPLPGIQAGQQLFSVNYFCRFRQLFLPVHLLFLTALLSYSGPANGHAPCRGCNFHPTPTRPPVGWSSG